MPKQKCGQTEVTVYLFFVIHQFQKPKRAVESFFLSACAQDRDIFKAPVYFENDGSSRLRGKEGKNQVWHSRYLTRSVKVLGLSHYPWRSVKTCSKTLLTRLGLPTPLPACV